MSLLVKAILVALFTWLTFFDKYCTQFFTYRPIVVGPIVGLIMGDVRMGLEVGCIIELMFLGQVFVGTALPPEETFSTIIATAFACISGSTEVALATALPLAIIGQIGMYFRNMVLCVWTQHRLEAAVEKGSRRGITMNCIVWPNIFNLRGGPRTGDHQRDPAGGDRRPCDRRRNDRCGRIGTAFKVHQRKEYMVLFPDRFLLLQFPEHQPDRNYHHCGSLCCGSLLHGSR